HAVPADDTHLTHVVRMALRDQLREPTVWKTIDYPKLSKEDAASLADVCFGVASAQAADFLFQHARQNLGNRNLVVRTSHHVARHVTPEANRDLLTFARGHKPDYLGLQAALFKAIERGTQERGGKFDDAARKWADELTGKLLASKNVADVQAGAEI